MSNVSEVKRKSIELNLDKVRHLKYTLNSFAEMEEKYGSVDQALAMVSENKISAIRFMLWAGLMHEDENLTEKQVGNMIEVDSLQDICNKLVTALDGDSPTAKQVEDTNSIVAFKSPNA